MPEAGYLLTPSAEQSDPIDINVDAAAGEWHKEQSDPIDINVDAAAGEVSAAICVTYHIHKICYFFMFIFRHSEQSDPIDINVDAAAGEVVITVQNSFLLRKGDPDGMGGGAGGEGALSKGFRARIKENLRVTKDKKVRYTGHLAPELGYLLDGYCSVKPHSHCCSAAAAEPKVMARWPGEGGEEPPPPDASPTYEVDEMGESCVLNGRMEVYLSLPDGACKRRLAITSPLVETAPPQCIALGAGSAAANGTFDLTGWRHGAPFYTNTASGVTIGRVELEGRAGWVMRKEPHKVYYCCTEASAHPPDLHWTLVSMGDGNEPPPTLMTSYQKRVKERPVDIRELPTPRWHPDASHFSPADAMLPDSDASLSRAASASPPPFVSPPPIPPRPPAGDDDAAAGVRRHAY
ncbi:hypothetical protein JKP88DRAFT_264860, partial [Tribonema minus]